MPRGAAAARSAGTARQRAAAAGPDRRGDSPDRPARRLERGSPRHRLGERGRRRLGRLLRARSPAHAFRPLKRRVRMNRTIARAVRQPLLCAVALVALVWLVPDVALAASSGGAAPMPWTGPLQTLLGKLCGPTARILAGLAFAGGGITWAFTRPTTGPRTVGKGNE